MADPVVEARLEEVVQNIGFGAAPLSVAHVADFMKGKYRDDFSDAANKAAYPRDEAKILALSQLVGLFAAFLTRAWAVVNGSGAPTSVDQWAANWAGYLVSTVVCPSPKGLVLMGRHCRSYQSPGAAAPAIAAALRTILDLLPAPTAGPLAR